MTAIADSPAWSAASLSGWILQSMNGVNGLPGWQWLFLLEALPVADRRLGSSLFFLDDGIAQGAAGSTRPSSDLIAREIERRRQGQDRPLPVATCSANA